MKRLLQHLRLAYILVLTTFVFLSCGSGSNPDFGPIYLLEDIQGDMAAQVKDFLSPQPWTGQTDGTLILQADSVNSLTPDQITQLQTLVKNGHAVLLVEAHESHLTAFHSLTNSFQAASLDDDDHFSVYVAGESNAGIRVGVVTPLLDASDPETDENKLERVKSVVTPVLLSLNTNAPNSTSLAVTEAQGITSLDTNNLPFQLTQSYAMPAEWSTCTHASKQTCQDNVTVQVSAWMVYCDSCAQTAGQATDYFIMEVSPNVNTSGCKGVMPGKSGENNRSAGYWLRQFDSSAQVPGAMDSDLTINLGPSGQGGYSPQDANPTVSVTQGTNWSLTGSGTAGPKTNFLNFGGGVSFINQTTVTYQALTTESNIGNTGNGNTLNTASWSYDSWNYVNSTIRPSNHACGGGGLEVDKALPNIIYGGAFNVTQTWVWQALPAIRQQFAGLGYLPVNVNNSMLLGWTFYGGGRACDPNGNGNFILPSGGVTYATSKGLSAGLEFDAGCDTGTQFGTIPLGHGGEHYDFAGDPYFNYGPQDNDIGNPGIPYPFTTFQINVPFAPIPAAPAISSITPTEGAPGTEITISGTGLSATTGVFFGGEAAAGFNVVDDSTVTAIAPGQAPGTTAIISVETNSGIAQGPEFTYSN